MNEIDELIISKSENAQVLPSTGPYLDQNNLYDYLKIIFPDVNDWIIDKCLPGYRFRPDYRSEQLKLIVEFDGYRHYTVSKQVKADQQRNELYYSLGYKVVRIPMFVQLTTPIIKLLFDVDVQVEQVYPHGFISDASTLILPADFCYIGIQRFIEDLTTFKIIRQDIIDSLLVKIRKLEDIDIVVPPNIKSLLI